MFFFGLVFIFIWVFICVVVSVFVGIRMRGSIVSIRRAFHLCEEPCLVDEEDVVFGHDERRPCQVFHAHVVLLIAELLRHPLLSLCQVHALWHDEDKP